MSEKDLKYFTHHEDEFLQKYQGRYIVIKDEEVKKDFDTEIEAYTYGVQNFGLGHFIIKHCIPGANKQTFFTRVKFA